jgi:uncharacterized protein (TIGR02147 family)
MAQLKSAKTPATPARPEVFRYSEYRTFLRDFHLFLKAGNPAVSHRYLAAKVGFDAGKFSDLFKLNRKEKEYFEILVLATHAKVPSDRTALLERLQPLRPKPAKPIADGLDEYYRNWFHPALRELLGFYPFRGDWKALAGMLRPEIKESEAKQGVERLTSLGFLTKDAQGRFRVTDPHITSGYKNPSQAINRFIKTGLELGRDALDSLPKEARNHSTMTFSTSENHFLQIQEKIRLFRKELADEVDKVEKPERVYQLNVQLFPLSGPWSPGR